MVAASDAGGGARRLIRSREVRARLAVSASCLERMKAQGRLPAPIVFNRNCQRWDADEIDAWIAAGCPTMDVWAEMKKAAAKR